MKLKPILRILVVVITAVMLTTVAIWAVYYRKPRELAVIPIPDSFYAQLTAAAETGAAWPKDPIGVAACLSGYSASDPGESNARIALYKMEATSAVVSVYVSCCQDDSVHQTWTLYYLAKGADGIWRPYRREGCWKGRGLIGWSTNQAQ